jgi:Protein of Unknown function (DUF2784)
MPSGLVPLNIAFFVFHTLWIGFICTAWAWRRTRRWHLAAVSLTALSWFGLGIWYGWGYCPFTDWHWRVRERLGYHDPPSYIQLLIRELAGIDLQPALADALALGTLIVVGMLTALLNVRDIRRPAYAAGPGDS